MKIQKRYYLTLLFLSIFCVSFSQNKKSSGDKIEKPILKSYGMNENQSQVRKDSLSFLKKSNATPELNTSSVVVRNLNKDITQDTLKSKTPELKSIGAYKSDE
ncbi:hypothetical protein [Hanstruepera marina]|uniref:hypothetical protein n=1 Tax=Hanstruepera marina TaxID=2873265 RepID=UPI001CA67043|nr:hypothetical protein [Hanstruepera marina]